VDSFSSIARLLNRACRAAPTGLNVELALRQHGNALPELLSPALGSAGGGGWQNVHSLSIEPERNSSKYSFYKVGQQAAGGEDGLVKQNR
jgi:hypothetical protein